mmetsp:Transcript_5235/g.6814  ORF Transcript_5235/g.6814 Transcript_5235/m.6814 type:complete len:127 (+) Transcript_5235:120-500(+)
MAEQVSIEIKLLNACRSGDVKEVEILLLNTVNQDYQDEVFVSFDHFELNSNFKPPCSSLFLLHFIGCCCFLFDLFSLVKLLRILLLLRVMLKYLLSSKNQMLHLLSLTIIKKQFLTLQKNTNKWIV